MIGPIEKQQPVRLERAEGVNRAGEDAKQSQAQPRRSDSVEISAEARQKAAAQSGGVTGLSAERVAEIRQRIQDGTYNSPEVIDAVARTMIERGDV